MTETPWPPSWFDRDDLAPLDRNTFHEHYDAIVDAIEQLTPAEQEVIELLFWGRANVANVATTLGISHQAVCDRRDRAFKKLKEILGGLDN